MDDGFFEPGGVYRHDRGGAPCGFDVFFVAHVGRAPAGFEDCPGTGETAFGWRRTVTGPDGAGRGLGPYVCHDAVGWQPVPDEELGPLLGSTIPDLAWPAPGRRRPQPPQ
ncbi:hypothetical protein [Kitasatospora sp. NPDC051914]|uniref:hypothetical protein n=1 Tax=Kitasatospora sp. NPDC051914 TaxID=3154945 RepID=UPI0034156938